MKVFQDTISNLDAFSILRITADILDLVNFLCNAGHLLLWQCDAILVFINFFQHLEQV